MIKPVQIADAAATIVKKSASVVSDVVSSGAKNSDEITADVNGSLLRAYNRIQPGKLFDKFEDFLTNFKSHIEEFKDLIPEALYRKLASSVDANDFALNKKVAEFYSGLNECKTLDDVRKMYPSIKLPERNAKQIVKDDIKTMISKETCERLAKLSSVEEKQEAFNKSFENIISETIRKSDVYPEMLKLRDEVFAEIISGKFKCTEGRRVTNFENTGRIPVIHQLLKTDYDKVIIDILKQSYIEGKPINEIVVKMPELEVRATSLNKRHKLQFFDPHFRRFLTNSEKVAGQFKDLKALDNSQISSLVMTQSWKTSGLRRDLANETRAQKPWDLVKAVWVKTMYPDKTFYPTSNLIDAHLLMLYNAGERTAKASNPFAKYLDSPYMDKNKIALLKRLYKESRRLDYDKRVLNSEGYKRFKDQFDLEGMTKTLETVEEHYKNAFFKRFWTDDRKARFAQALNENRELANNNIELSEKILAEAMNTIFAEA